LEESIDWVYRHLHHGGERLVELLDRDQPRALRQAARELLLAQSSDWLSLLRAGSHADYARRRLCEHLRNLAWLCDSVERGEVEEGTLVRLEERNSLFPDLDLADFANGEP
jgi:1,4-alpha-glucan branching enzyme